MIEEDHSKLWVIKFCLKVVFPTYNLYQFLVYLTIRYRIFYHRLQLLNSNQDKSTVMEIHRMHCVPANFLKRLMSLSTDANLLQDSYSKCLAVSQISYNRMVTENPFFYDHRTVWASVHLAPELIERLKDENSSDDATSINCNLKKIKSVIHKQLWEKKEQKNYQRVRIVRVFGSHEIPHHCVLVSEDEGLNVKSSFGIPFENDNISLELKSVGSIDYVPQIASTATVQLILNPYDLSNIFITEVLSNHFNSPRLVHIGDIFSVELTKENTTKYYYKYFDLIQSTSKIYFICSKISSDDKDVIETNGVPIQLAYFIVKGKTELHLGENIHSAISAHRHLGCGIEKNKDVLESCPFGLLQYFQRMQESILPFLVSRQNNTLHLSVVVPVMPIFLLSGAMGSGRHLLVNTLAKYNGINCLVVDCNAIQCTTAKQTESKITSLIQHAKACSPTIVLMDNFEVFAVDAENSEDCRVLEFFRNTTLSLYQNYTKHSIIIFAVTEFTDLKPNIQHLFLDKFNIAKLTSSERYQMLEWYMRAMGITMKNNCDNLHRIDVLNATDVDICDANKDILQRISAKTESFLYGDIDTLVHFALRNSFMRQTHDSNDSRSLHTLEEDDLTTALENMRGLQSQHMDAPKIPKVYWEDIGGLESLKKELLKTIEFPIKYPHLFKNSSLKRSGILLYGPPGCGKTLVAKALSTELNVSFLSVKGPELLNMYIGQSEENVRKVFESARAASPCIVFLDELDALAPRRGATGDSGGASDRVVSQLLAEVDGVADGAGAAESSFVFIMGATNRPDLLEQSLLRPGRLDKLIYVGPYCGIDEKTRVLTALCRRCELSAEVSLREVARSLPQRCTGADLMSVVSVARASAVRRAVALLQSGGVTESALDSSSVVVQSSDLAAGVAAFRPSATDEDFAYYESLHTQL